jgi:choline dehydrogenase-like flavoprotein
VLLVEAGSKPEGEYLRAPFHRYLPSVLRPDLDHAFVSTPQKALNNRTIPYTRGKGLGGSTILNFALYLYGSAEDYNQWARLVGDNSWNWENTKKSFQAIEQYDFQAADQYLHLAKPKQVDHGEEGMVRVCLPPTLEQGLAYTMESLIANGEKINLDVNSGDPIGVSIFPSSYGKDGRTTSATAHLLDPPDNLTIWTGAPVHRLEFDGTRVVGVRTEDGRQGE